jgi:hypothetical protein
MEENAAPRPPPAQTTAPRAAALCSTATSTPVIQSVQSGRRRKYRCLLQAGHDDPDLASQYGTRDGATLLKSMKFYRQIQCAHDRSLSQAGGDDGGDRTFGPKDPGHVIRRGSASMIVSRECLSLAFCHGHISRVAPEKRSNGRRWARGQSVSYFISPSLTG